MTCASKSISKFFLILGTHVLLGSQASAAGLSCREFLTSTPSLTENKPSFGVETLKISQLIQKVDWKALQRDQSTLNPNLSAVAYDKSQAHLLKEFNLPLNSLSESDRVLETDYGYAIVNVHQLRDWQMLSSIINDPAASKAFLEKVANTEGYYPNSITKNSADWLRWSLFAEYESRRKSIEQVGPHPFANQNYMSMFDYIRPESMKYYADLFKAKRAEFRRLIRQKNIAILPFGVRKGDNFNEIAEEDASLTLSILARYFVISKLIVQRNNGEAILLSEFVDQDALILFSRYPELLPLYPMFEDGHFEIANEETTVGHEDVYGLALTEVMQGELASGVTYSVSFNPLMDDDEGVTGVFFLNFDGYDQGEDSYKELTLKVPAQQIHRLYSDIIEKLNHMMAIKSSKFTQLTGVELPVFLVEFDQSSDRLHPEFIFYNNDSIEPNLFAAFLMFAALDGGDGF